MNYIYKDGELYHYGVKGMKWGVRRSRVTDAISQRVKKKRSENKEQLKDDIASNNPASKIRREQAKEREKRQSEMNEIVQAKGKTKALKILKKIGSVLTSNRPDISNPWNEKPDRNYRGGRI